MTHGPLIDIKKYATQTGQLVSMGRDKYGDASVTSVTTIKCLVYTGVDEQDQTNPAITEKVEKFAVIPTPSSVKTHDHLKNVVDRWGNVVLDDARILEVQPYDHWKYAPRFLRVTLDVDLD